MIKLNNLNKYYNKGKQNEIHVVNNIELELPEKGMVAIFGKSGCGKTTLLNLIGGLDKYESGSILIDDIDLNNHDLNEIRNKYIGYIFQNYNLDDSINCFENIANALKLCDVRDEEYIEKCVLTALKNVGMEKYKKRTPDTLSGGQQQRIAIARAIVKNPKIILADEPTGNLDDKNTLMIMNLLKEISKNHLVLLVTHEETLVKQFCDTVINISDGKVIDINNNEIKEKSTQKRNNDIYLGELAKKEISLDEVNIEYYGDAPSEDINIKIINNDGKLYIKILNEKIKILDESSEVKLIEGKFEKTEVHDYEIKNHSNITELELPEGKKYGSLYTLKSSIKSSLINNFKNRRKLDRNLHICLCLFAIVIVIFTGSFGTLFKSLDNINESFNHNMFYVYINNDEISKELFDKINDPNVGIDDINLDYTFPSTGLDNLRFNAGSFETFDDMYLTNISVYSTLLDHNMIGNKDLVVGKKDNLNFYDMVITTETADKILAKSQLESIKDYYDLLGVCCANTVFDNRPCVIAGIVKSDECSSYINPVILAYNINKQSGLSITLDKETDLNVEKGKGILLLVKDNKLEEKPNVGDTVFINGQNITIDQIFIRFNNYEEWLQYYYPEIIKKCSSFYNDIVKTKMEELYPDKLFEEMIGTPEYKNIYTEVSNNYYFDYLDLYNSKIDEYLNNLYLFENNDQYLWLYVKKDIDIAKYYFINNGENYYKAVKYKEEHGVFPNNNEINDYNITPLLTDIDYYIRHYEFEFNIEEKHRIRKNEYVIDESDFISISKQKGKTDAIENSTIAYAAVHSNNPELTEKWLYENLSFTNINHDYPVLVTPTDLYYHYKADVNSEITMKFTSLVAIFSLMSLCMYFIMKSSTLNRIKEIGMYRAIGVSKKNFIFKFIVESSVITLFTVVVGYILSSGFIFIALRVTKSIELMIYYPWYLAIFVLIMLICISIFCGIIPILLILRKTPSEILSKYDI